MLSGCAGLVTGHVEFQYGGVMHNPVQGGGGGVEFPLQVHKQCKWVCEAEGVLTHRAGALTYSGRVWRNRSVRCRKGETLTRRCPLVRDRGSLATGRNVVPLVKLGPRSRDRHWSGFGVLPRLDWPHSIRKMLVDNFEHYPVATFHL